MVPISYYLILSAVLFVIGIVGVIVKRNAIVIFMSIELMLNSVNLVFVAFFFSFETVDGHIFVFMVMAVAAAEVAVGLALIVALFKARGTVNIDEINIMKW